MNEHLSLSSRIVLTPRRAGLLAGQDNTVDVLVRIQAPDAPAGHTAVRPPQAIALVIDRSGSMEGRPLAEARRCAEYVVGKLRPTDACRWCSSTTASSACGPPCRWATARRCARRSQPSTLAATPTCTVAGARAPRRWPTWPAPA